MHSIRITRDSGVIVGHVLDGLRILPAQSVHCVMSSPPYWGGIRDYQIPDSTWGDGWIGCYGNEPTVEQYVTHTLEIFGELRRVLRHDGVIWWNIGDCYTNTDVAPGNKVLAPYRVALALQADGWIVRQDNVWHKKSPMPESIDGVRWERCRVKTGQRADCPGCNKCEATNGLVLRRGSWRSTTSHEYVFQITKTMDYFCDAAAAQEPTTGNAHSRGKGVNPKAVDITAGDHLKRIKQNDSFADAVKDIVLTRNPRSVWSLSSEAYKGKHFAAYPTALVWKCIQASTSKAGCCPACGAQYAPLVEKKRAATRPGNDTKVGDYMVLDPDSPYQAHAGTICGNRDPQRHTTAKQVVAYLPTCTCDAGDPVPCVILDPFTGSGTTLQVAINTGRQFVGCEIGEQYIPLIQERAATPWVPPDQRKKSSKPKRKHANSQGRLF